MVAYWYSTVYSKSHWVSGQILMRTLQVLWQTSLLLKDWGFKQNYKH